MATPFQPNPAKTVNIDVAASSARVAIAGAPTSVRVMNDGTATAWINFGDVTVTAAVATSMPVGPGVTEVLSFPNLTAANVLCRGYRGRLYRQNLLHAGKRHLMAVHWGGRGRGHSSRWTASASGGTPTPPLYSVSPVISGSRGGTLTATPGTASGSPAYTGQWRADGVQIAGATALTFDDSGLTWSAYDIQYFETATNGGGSDYAVSNTIAATGFKNLAITTTFTGTDAAKLNALPSIGTNGAGSAVGFTLVRGGDAADGSGSPSTTNQDRFALLSNKLRSTAASGLSAEYRVAIALAPDTGFTDQVAELTCDGTNIPTPLVLRYVDGSNFLLVRSSSALVSGNRWFRVIRYSAGVATNLTTNDIGIIGDLTSTTRLKVTVEGTSLKLFYDHSGSGSYVQAFTASSFQTPTSGFPPATITVSAAAGGATKAGVAQSWSVVTGSDNVSIAGIGSSVNVSSAAASINPDGIFFTVAGTYIGSPTSYTVAVEAVDGTPLQAATAPSGSTISGGSFSLVTVPSAATEGYTGSSVRLIITDNLGNSQAYVASVPVLASVSAINIGMNEEFWNPWATSDALKDHGERGTWVQSSYSDIPLANLDPVTLLPASYPGATTSIINKLVEGGMCKAGDYDVTYPTGMTAAAATMTNASVVNAFSGGTGRVNVANDIGATCQISLSGTIPAGGAWVTMTPVGDPNPANPFTDQVLADYNALGGAGPIRFMTPQGINSRLGFAPDAVDVVTGTNNLTDRRCKIETMVALCNATGRDLWFCVHHLADLTYVQWAGAYIAANLDPALKCFVEWSNEVWNGLFTQADWTAWRGAAEGYYNTNGDAAASSPSFNFSNEHFAASTGYPVRTFSTGERVVGNLFGTGVCMWEALQAVPIGVTGVLPASGSNTYWTRIASPTETARARARFQMEASIMCFDAFDAAFVTEGYAARSRVKRVLGVWALDTTADILTRLNWQNGYLKTDMIAPAFYVGGGVAGYSLGSYTSGHITGWGATEKARYNTNLSQWLTDLFAALNTATDPTIDLAVAMKHGLEVELRAAPYNLAPNTIELGQYECGQHVGLSNYPNSTDAGTAFAAYRSDARLGTWMSGYLDKLKSRLGGTHCIFSMVSQNAGVQGWGIMFQQGDQTNDQFEAVSGWIAANP